MARYIEPYEDCRIILNKEDVGFPCRDLPTADVEEVRHGEWEFNMLDNYKKYSVTCPFCSAEYTDNYDGYINVDDFNYCPNCGARMDGGKE